MMKLGTWLSAAVIVVGTAFGASAKTVNDTSNVVFIVDESGSMSGEHNFLKDVVTSLDSALAAAGVTTRSYGVVGFGASFSNPGSPRTLTDFVSAEDAKTAMSGLRLNGGTEDGYTGINHALDNLSYASGAAINYVLVTDEDRDNVDNALTYGSVYKDLADRKILLNAVVNARYNSDGGYALGIDSTGEAYVADGSGGFTRSTGGVAVSGSGSTISNYVQLALDTGGAAWDLNQLRAGGNTAMSFTQAFLDIKVEEITTQPTDPSPVPVPAAFPLLLGGLGVMGAIGRRRRKNG